MNWTRKINAQSAANQRVLRTRRAEHEFHEVED